LLSQGQQSIDFLRSGKVFVGRPFDLIVASPILFNSSKQKSDSILIQWERLLGMTAFVELDSALSDLQCALDGGIWQRRRGRRRNRSLPFHAPKDRDTMKGWSIRRPAHI
jgi:hypothetical protein